MAVLPRDPSLLEREPLLLTIVSSVRRLQRNPFSFLTGYNCLHQICNHDHATFQDNSRLIRRDGPDRTAPREDEATVAKTGPVPRLATSKPFLLLLLFIFVIGFVLPLRQDLV